MEAKLTQLNSLLAESSYIGSIRCPTDADFKCALQLGDVPDVEQFPHVARWYQHIMALKKRHAGHHTFPVAIAHEADVTAECSGTPIATASWPLLPCEMHLQETLQSLAVAQSADEREAALIEVLRAHPWVDVRGRLESDKAAKLGAEIGSYIEEHFRLRVYGKKGSFNDWLKNEGRPFLKEAGGCSDDGIYTLSAVLRNCMPRGLSLFTFHDLRKKVLIRGFRKFTGLKAEDEDEDSGATGIKEDFYFKQGSDADSFSVTSKSNGENGKFAVRLMEGTPLLFSGSKNTCCVWRADRDVNESFSPASGYIPGRKIANMVQEIWHGWNPSVRDAFVDRVAVYNWTLMLEINSAESEHIFPIPEDFLEFVAILDDKGLPLPQRQAFALFDEFKLRRVHCELGLPMSLFAQRLDIERDATDREGAVVYLESADGSAVGLLKVKSSFYVRARRTREIIRACVMDPLLKGTSREELAAENGTVEGLSGNRGWKSAERRLRTGMKNLHHVEGCAEHSQEWAEVAVSFLNWLRKQVDAVENDSELRIFAQKAKDKYGSMYRDFCYEFGLPGGDN